MKILVLAGAGTSIELGVPGMAGMASEFIEHTKQWNVEPDLVKHIIGETLDIEHLIEDLDRISLARPSLQNLGQDQSSFDQVEKVRAEVEWFVQHAAERIKAFDAWLMWGPVLQATRRHSITFVTTNYDRAIELAANAEGIDLEDGFAEFGHGETAEWRGFDPAGRSPNLIKLHGSTDWYAKAGTGRPVKLRHPMPLFGRSTLTLANSIELGSALVLPSREKLLTRAPYPRLSQAFLNAADSCDLAVFIGSSLRDHHILGAAQAAADRVPTFVVGPTGTDGGVLGAIPVRQSASIFLISTFPVALGTSDPGEWLRSASRGRAHVEIDGLEVFRRTLNPRGPVEDRCQAIDELDSCGVTLDPHLLRSLISDPNPTVSRYALGLLSLSPDRDDLLSFAESLEHVQDPAFLQDLKLLRALVDGETCKGSQV